MGKLLFQLINNRRVLVTHLKKNSFKMALAG